MKLNDTKSKYSKAVSDRLEGIKANKISLE